MLLPWHFPQLQLLVWPVAPKDIMLEVVAADVLAPSVLVEQEVERLEQEVTPSPLQQPIILVVVVVAVVLIRLETPRMVVLVLQDS